MTDTIRLKVGWANTTMIWLVCVALLGTTVVLAVLSTALIIGLSGVAALFVVGITILIGWATYGLFCVAIVNWRCQTTFHSRGLTSTHVIAAKGWLPRFETVSIDLPEIARVFYAEQLVWTFFTYATNSCVWVDLTDERRVVIASCKGSERVTKTIAEETGNRAHIPVLQAPNAAFRLVEPHGGVVLQESRPAELGVARL